MSELITVPSDVAAVRSSEQEIAVLEPKMRGIVIKSDTGFAQVADHLKQVKRILTELETTRTSITKPINDGLSALNNLFRSPRERLQRLEHMAKQAMGDYNRMIENRRREEQARADDKARKEREALEARALAAQEQGKATKAAELMERAEATTAPVLQREAPRVTGVSMRKVWKWRLIDAAKIPRQYLIVDEKGINATVKALGERAQIEGIEVYEDTVVASGRE